ncbi:hypothetical protein HNR60_000677 [Rhodopseudomonas rhenobacensis]|uniref:Arc-like DNA binding domain-containing protein n=1 Tax=Rhodopseudomonas rhenobacensis TaxID=87461 RepID=A0A7W7Z1F9_9BRAD|nr:Arc family DNA-binding protein [Rhodopseudomonas rhenobacensis]MBB5045942.1 hypothetical protein [Rhodopseudomonas rhenobacensis]
MKKPSDIVQLKLRFSERLRRRLEKAADESGDSMNAEIIRRIERSFEKQDLLTEVLTLAYGPQMAGLLREVTPAIRAFADSGLNQTLTISRDVKGSLKVGFKASADGEVDPPTDEEFDEMVRRHAAVSKPEGQS